MNWPKSLDPAHQPALILSQCYECGQDFAPLSEDDNLCEECQEIAALPYCEEHNARGKCKQCYEDGLGDYLRQLAKDEGHP